MRTLATIALLLLLAGCTGSSGTDDPQQAINAALAVLESGITQRDAQLASEPIGAQFFLDANVASRYTANTWDPTRPGPSQFRQFFSGVFPLLANTRQVFAVTNVDVNGEIATATVESDFDAVRTDSTPATNVTFSTTDTLLFELENGAWRLERWDESIAPVS